MNKLEQILKIDNPADLNQFALEVEQQTKQYLSKDIVLYTPIYITNYCNNNCTYCAFKSTNDQIERTRLNLEQFERECQIVRAMGFQQVVIVGGEDYKMLTVDFLKQLITISKEYFKFVSLEIQPLKLSQYQELKKAGLDGVTIYQETYDLKAYQHYHIGGPKSNYERRLKRLEEAIQGGIKAINIGVLLGLGDYYQDILSLNDHLQYLQRTYPGVEYSVSILRIKAIKGEQSKYRSVSDFDLVKAMIAIRKFNPTVSLTMSTRENVNLKKNLFKYGVKKISANVSTAVGGHSHATDNGQFKISDESSIEQQMQVISEAGYIPVLQDWS